MAVVAPELVQGQGNYAPQGSQHSPAGTLIGDQVRPNVRIKTTGGYVVWQDNYTDGAGLGISARKLDSSFSGTLSPFRVNASSADDQENAAVSLLTGGGAVFVWQGGKQSFQHIYARVLSPGGTWVTGDIRVNAPTNVFQRDAAIATLKDGSVVIVWSSMGQASASSMQDVYSQILTPAGIKVGGEVPVNQAIAYNQRSAAVASLSDGRYVVVWISEQQRFGFGQIANNANGAPPNTIGSASVDVYGRIYNASGLPAGGEFLINSADNICANPTVAASPDGGFAVSWMQKDPVALLNSWDVFVRPFSANALAGVTRRVNTQLYGDQLAPKISAMGMDYLVVWTSMGQDGSYEGVYGQNLQSDGALAGPEFRMNTTTASQQIEPTLASDGVATFLTVWTSFVGGANSFDLFSQRYVNTSQPLNPPGAPIVTVLSSNSLSVSWPPVQGFSIANYEVNADGSATATAVVSNTYWTVTGLTPNSTHSYRLAYVVADGRRSPLSGSTTNTTYGAGATWGGVPQEWMTAYFGGDIFAWPAPFTDSDADGASNKDEFLAGTDPTQASSVLKVRLEATVQGFYLNWNTEAGLMYQIQTAASTGGDWANLGGPRFAAGTTDSIYLGGSSAGFYRIVRLR